MTLERENERLLEDLKKVLKAIEDLGLKYLPSENGGVPCVVFDCNPKYYSRVWLGAGSAVRDWKDTEEVIRNLQSKAHSASITVKEVEYGREHPFKGFEDKKDDT